MSANDLEGEDIWGGGESKEAEIEDDETRHMSIGELRQRIHLLNNDIRIMKSDVQRITHESRAQRDRIRDNQEKVKLNKQLPYLVANVVEILEPHAEDGTEHILHIFSQYTSHFFFLSLSHSCLVLSYMCCAVTFRSRSRRYGNGRCY